MSARERWGHVADLIGRLMYSSGVCLCCGGAILSPWHPDYMALLWIGVSAVFGGLAWGRVASLAWFPDASEK